MWEICGERAGEDLLQGMDQGAVQVYKGSPSQVLAHRFGREFFNSDQFFTRKQWFKKIAIFHRNLPVLIKVYSGTASEGLDEI